MIVLYITASIQMSYRAVVIRPVYITRWSIVMKVKGILDITVKTKTFESVAIFTTSSW